jgi:exodeoxyribonuclease V alpha subunit
LEFEPRSGRFQRDGEHPLDTDALVVDEASMVDVPLAAALLEALPTAARLVIVGDSDQLPSVGPGAFLRDVIDSGAVPTVRLTEIFRQAEQSGIVQNAHRILRGEPPEGAESDSDGADFFIVNRREPEEAAEVVRELVENRIPRRFGLDPKRDVQVLTPMHRGAAGTIALNAILQGALNPDGVALESRGQKLRPGDKVMQIRNDYERDVFNGDIGIVSSVNVTDRTLSARFDDREVEYEDSDLDSLTLAYATSIHKSQGSEYPAVVVPFLSTHFVMLSRNLLYTAVTRARRLCVLVADPRAIRIALAEFRKGERLTRLADRMRGARNV